MYLAVDIGGTKVECGLYAIDNPHFTSLFSRRYESCRYVDLSDIVSRFIKESGYDAPEVAGFGVAGPVKNGRATVTNLPWIIDAESLKDEFGFSYVHLINDLTSVAASISIIEKNNLYCLHEAVAQPGGMIGVVAPGTGLGEGYLLENEDIFLPMGSEGGHADFAPVNELQMELLGWMLGKMQMVSYEDIIAGPGISHLYDFFVQCKGERESADIAARLCDADDRTPIIVEGGLGENPCPLCFQVIELFLSILGSEIGNKALKIFATGGMYIGGGIVPRLIGRISFDPLVSAYLAKGKMKDLVASIPLYIINVDNAALLGIARCTKHCAEKMQRM